MRDYTKIKAWELADDLTVAVYEATRGFPREEVYSLTSQIRRAAYSVPANIAEGASRESKKDYLHFLYIARGSLNETRYFIHLARRLGYLKEMAAEPLASQADEASRTLTGLILAVERETGLFTRTAAKVTSMLALSLGSALLGLRSVVFGL
jgi:four helix bundle protein